MLRGCGDTDFMDYPTSTSRDVCPKSRRTWRKAGSSSRTSEAEPQCARCAVAVVLKTHAWLHRTRWPSDGDAGGATIRVHGLYLIGEKGITRCPPFRIFFIANAASKDCPA